MIWKEQPDGDWLTEGFRVYGLEIVTSAPGSREGTGGRFCAL